MENRPATLPPGIRLELTRHRIKPGKSAEVDEWMRMLNNRSDECRASLGPERMAVEAIFRLTDEHGEWLYWFELSGDAGEGLNEDRAIVRDHIAHSERCKVPGHVAATLQVLLLPAPVEHAIRHWASYGASAELE